MTIRYFARCSNIRTSAFTQVLLTNDQRNTSKLSWVPHNGSRYAPSNSSVHKTVYYSSIVQLRFIFLFLRTRFNNGFLPQRVYLQSVSYYSNSYPGSTLPNDCRCNYESVPSIPAVVARSRPLRFRSSYGSVFLFLA